MDIGKIAVRVAKKKLADYNDPHEIVITGKGDGMISLAKMIRYMMMIGNWGHSFSITVDPDSDTEKSFGWDGDGADSIKSVELDNKEVEKDEDWK